MKNKVILPLMVVAALFLQTSCENQTPTDLTKISIIPKPVSVTSTGDRFEVSEPITVYFNEEADGLQQIAEYLAAELSRISGIEAGTQSTSIMPKVGIYLDTDSEDTELSEEGYELNIGNRVISIQAGTPAGCFYGVQTLLQILPAAANSGTPLEVASGTIRDFPEFSYRGAMLDVSRHFFHVDEVKRFIDLLAAYKMNVLHLHLSDDQGWRIEIKSWPKLTETGGSTEVGGGEGGFYTQEEYSDLVKYAQERQITIVPEIDMPGHTNAALASYPELNCNGKATELYTGTKVGFSTLCTDKEVTYKFIDDVVREISELTPGPYFHIGGDESHSTPMEDYIPFVNRVQEIVVSHGKKVIGWDEIANASLVDNAIVQFWADVENTTMGVQKGAKVIMSPAKKAYLDMQYDSTSHLGLHWAGYIEVDTGYIWNPATYVPGITKEDILGVEAPLWSETVTDIKDIEYMVFPRLPGYAEIGWTAPEARNWDDYKDRLARQGKRFDDMEIGFYRSKTVPWED